VDPQVNYQDRILAARKQLIEGRIDYTELPEETKPGEQLSFTAVISGDEMTYREPGPGASGKVEKASIGALIGVELHCSGAGVKCTPLSAERQNVLDTSDEATWRWTIEPGKAGDLNVTLTATSYYQDTRNVLDEHDTDSQRVVVKPTVASTAGSITQWLLLVLGALGGVGGLASGFALLRRRGGRRSSRRDGGGGDGTNARA
jgi:hypothetical protein